MATLLMFFWPTMAGADPLLLGGETGAMGGAGVASGSDAGMFLLNPAGLARVSSLRVSFSGSLYALSRIKVDKFFNDNRPATTPLGVTVLDDLELSSNKIIAVPSVVSVLMGLGPKAGQSGHMVLGGSIVMPENRSYFFEGETNATAAYIGKHSNLYAHESVPDLFRSIVRHSARSTPLPRRLALRGLSALSQRDQLELRCR